MASTTPAKASVSIPAFQATPLDDITAKCKAARSAFRTNKTKDLEWRKVQLRKLYWALEDFGPQLIEALMRDLHKSEYETCFTELDWVKNDCLWSLKHMDRLAADEKLGSPDVSWTYAAMGVRLRKEPIGSVLIIGAYNYPIQLTVSPLINAITAGCTAVVKPSELSPATAAVLAELVESRLDSDAYSVVNGAVPETTRLLDFDRWDKILYTGSTEVGKVVSRKAAEHLTPVALELGGRNPAFVTRHANLKVAARRLLWAKTLNAGQVCISHNYALVEREILEPFLAALREAFADFFPDGAEKSELAHVVNERHFLRIKKMLDDSRGRIVLGGKMDRDTLFMETTAVLVDSMDDAVIAQESFGPVFGILPVHSLTEAINIANAVDRTPLALATFGSKAENDRGECPLLGLAPFPQLCLKSLCFPFPHISTPLT